MKTEIRYLSLRVIGALMVREMITRYGRTWGGYFWAILEPVGVILILSLAFSQVIHKPAIGSSFIMFYATGYIPFHFFLETSINTGGAVSLNRQLMLLPAVTPLDAVIARFLLSILTLIVVASIVFSGLLILIDDQVSLSLDSLFLSLSCGAIVGLGVGTFNSVVFSFVPSWRQLWGIISRPLFIISGVFFTFEQMPEGVRQVLWWNPLVHVVGESRKAFYASYEGAYIALWYPLGFGLFFLLVGAAFLIRNRSAIIEARH